MKKRMLSLFLAVALLCSLLPQFTLPARAEDLYSGSCGETLSWRFDPDSGTLTIEGSGAMSNFARESIPWSNYREAITAVSLPEGLTAIGNFAFENCSALTSVSIPNSVTSIDNFAFSDCSALTSVSIPDSVTYIGSSAFSDCSSLTGVSIPNSVTSIDTYAFSYCTSLTSVTIPDSVTDIGYSAFRSCSALTAIHVAENNPNYSSQDGVLFDKAKTKLIQYPAGKADASYTIPNSVTSIGDGAFSGCSALTGVSIPNSVTSIGMDAFYGCSALTSVTIPNSVTSISHWAFGYCSALTSVSIPNSVTSIGLHAFYYCSALTSVSIPNSVTSIRDSAFSHCTSLTSVTIPDSVTSISDSAFSGCSALTSVSIPNSVTSIGMFAFKDCSALTGVTIPNSVTSIGSGAFRNCGALTSVKIPNSVTSISDSAFYGCSALTSVTIPDSVTDIGNWAFGSCSALTSVTIPDSVTDIGNWAFRNCGALTSVKIPDSVTYIGTEAFGWSNTGRVEGFTVYGSSGSAAQSYAKNYGIPFVVYEPPVITDQPQSLKLSLGQSTTLKVTATGNDLRYQWQYKRAGDADWTTWAGKTRSTQKITASDTNNGCQYRCLVSNAVGSAFSKPATLTVLEVQPVITGQPKSLSLSLGQSTTFKVTATGGNLRYQWQYKRDGAENWITWSGRSSASLKVTASDTNNGCQYRCVVSNAKGSVYSEPATLTVLEVQPVITGQPQSLSLNLGQSATFKVTATGGNLRYQWQYKRDGAENWITWSGRTSATLKVTASDTNKGCQYRCIVSNAVDSVTSNAATLTLGSKLERNTLNGD